MGDNNRFVDELLDGALVHHHDAEPRAGLEGRILAHVRATASERCAARKAWRLWAASAATAAVLVLIAIYTANRVHHSAPQEPQAANSAPVAPPTETLKASSEPAPATASVTKVVQPKQVARRVRKPLRHVEAHHWPSQFPTPAPLTPEQRVLVQYVQQTPPKVLTTPILKATFTAERVEVKTLEIPSLKIKPLVLGPDEKEVQ